jgi:trehalose synthase-fused probable maltokinase
VGATDRAAEALVHLAATGGRASGPASTVVGHWLAGEPGPGASPARSLGADQSNTSVAVGGTHVLKIFRRLMPGTHPEVEVGRHLHAVQQAAPAGTPPLPVAPLAGWYELVGDDGATTLGVVSRFVAGALDGWALTLSGLAADPGDLLHRLRALGVAVARLHAALGAPALESEAFGRRALRAEDLRRLVADGTAALDRHADVVPPTVVGRVKAAIDRLAADLERDLGPAIRTHGDLHLGQTVVGADGWVILDFEGEPDRPIADRRRHQSPLRDVAGLLRSLSYAAETVRRSGTPVSAGWEPAARAAVLDGYLATAEPDLLPGSASRTRALLALFELEKAVYEIGYERAHRPDWLPVPLVALERVR